MSGRRQLIPRESTDRHHCSELPVTVILPGLQSYATAGTYAFVVPAIRGAHLVKFLEYHLKSR